MKPGCLGPMQQQKDSQFVQVALKFRRIWELVITTFIF